MFEFLQPEVKDHLLSALGVSVESSISCESLTSIFLLH